MQLHPSETAFHMPFTLSNVGYVSHMCGKLQPEAIGLSKVDHLS